MMYVYTDPDEWETVVEHGDFGYSWSQKRRPYEEVIKIKAERLRKEEDEILAKAKIIMASRGLNNLDEF